MSIFSEEHLSAACAYCFDVLVGHFELEHKVPEPELPDGKFPLFVTWKIADTRQEWRLRGCIGTFGEKPLLQGLREYAKISALNDSRFKPMQKKEIPKLAVNTSFLTNFEDGKDCYDWAIGTHGITINFQHLMRSYSATYLPEVCPEQGWTKEECLNSLMRKSGYRGKINPELRKSVKLTRYQSVKAKMTYKEYAELRF